MSTQVIAYVSGAEMRTVDADGAHNKLVHRLRDGRPLAPCWSPDGKAIAWLWSPRGTIWRTDPSGGRSSLVLSSTQCGGACRNPKWSPLGDEIAIIADRDRLGLPDALLVVPVAGGPARTLYAATAGYSLLDVAWSGNGTRLAVSEYQPGSLSDRIRIIDRATGAAATVLDDSGAISFLDWARHKEQLAFTRALRSGEPGVFTCDLPASGALASTTAVIFRTAGSRPSYSPDDTELVFQRIPPPHKRSSLHAIDLNSGEERLVTSKGMSPNWRRGRLINPEAQAVGATSGGRQRATG